EHEVDRSEHKKHRGDQREASPKQHALLKIRDKRFQIFTIFVFRLKQKIDIARTRRTERRFQSVGAKCRLKLIGLFEPLLQLVVFEVFLAVSKHSIDQIVAVIHQPLETRVLRKRRIREKRKRTDET